MVPDMRLNPRKYTSASSRVFQSEGDGMTYHVLTEVFLENIVKSLRCSTIKIDDFLITTTIERWDFPLPNRLTRRQVPPGTPAASALVPLAPGPRAPEIPS